MGNVHNKRDANEAEIVRALLDAGCSVQLLRNSGAGVPDLLVGFRSVTFLLEVKAPKGRLSGDQVRWQAWWQGRPVSEVRTVEDALIAIGILKAAA